MRKMSALFFAVFFVAVFAGPVAADPIPFFTQWNLDKSFVHGKVKTVTQKRGKARAEKTYDEKGRLDTETIYDKFDNKLRSSECIYEDGELVQVNMFQGANIHPMRERATYTEDGKLYGINSPYAPHVAEFVHDDKGNLQTIYTLVPQGRTKQRWEFKWNDKGQLVEVSFIDHKDDVKDRVTRTYYDNGDLSGKKNFNGEGKMRWERTYKYEYDKRGNWIKKITTNTDYEEGKEPWTRTVEEGRFIQYWD